ncbi:LOW QUALITY PROTEIN: probable sarcosine oxidase [Setaria italica]|uniref:LOW QUALITY PROTEIN: probable sarcosine oxidase n=1 Tax=Setaria italica TaxID=4555 RepID=UPI000BE5E5C2|nr:LOW QUALITY PROTEIN: probable sarcosine oxidase [Setaria italica]
MVPRAYPAPSDPTTTAVPQHSRPASPTRRTTTAVLQHTVRAPTRTEPRLPWTSKLGQVRRWRRLPIQPLHTLVLYWRIKPNHERELTAEAGFPSFSSVRPHYVYSTPSLEHPGMIKINYHGGPPCDPDGHGLVSGGVDAVERVARWIDEFMPGRVETASGPVERVPCMYSMTPDEDFVIDFLGDFGQDMVIGAGFSGHEFKMGPAVGSILAEMAMDGEARTVAEAGVELGHLRINRFDGNPMGNAKDL